jgi:hypothetical protein
MATSKPRFPARFDPDAWETDLARSTPAGRTAAQAARSDYEPGGVPRSHLKPCEPEGRDGNNLVNCAKVYVPHPDGQWGMVFVLKFEPNGRPVLMFLAFGVRHHPKGSHALNVYDYAGARLLEITARDLRAQDPGTEKRGA